LIFSGNLYCQPNFDSINSIIRLSPDPGRKYLEIGKQLMNIPQLDNEPEESKMNKFRHEYNFWESRLPVGSGVIEPKGVYSNVYNQALQAVSTNAIGCNASTDQGAWENTGPNYDAKPTDATWFNNEQSQGRVYALWNDPADVNIILAGTIGGLFKTNNGGKNWVNISDNIQSIGAVSIKAIAVNPFNKLDIYIGTEIWNRSFNSALPGRYGQGMWHTVNGGVSWIQETLPGLTNTAFVEAIQFCPHKVNTTDVMIVASHSGKIFQKIGLAAWVNITPTSNYVEFTNRAFEFTDASIGKFYLQPMEEVFYGTNNWNVPLIEVTYNSSTGLIGAFTNILDYTFTGSGLDFGNSIYLKSGSTCAAATVLSPAKNYVRSYKVKYAGNGILYGITCNINGAVVSPNTCIQSSTPASQFNFFQYDINANSFQVNVKSINNFSGYGHNYGCMEIAVHPNNPDIVYIGSLTPIKITKNASNIWTCTSLATYGFGTHNIHADVRSIRIATSIANTTNSGIEDIVYWGTDGGISILQNNIMTSINGKGLYLSQVYDLAISKSGVNSIHQFDNGAAWAKNTNGTFHHNTSEGFTTIFDERVTALSKPKTITTQPGGTLEKGNYTGLGVTSAGAMGDPTDPSANPYPNRRAYDFSGTDFYFANFNAFRTQPNAYGTWDQETDNGIFAVSPNAKYLAREFIVSKNNPSIKYYCGANLPIASQNAKVVAVTVQSTISPFPFEWKDITPPTIINSPYNRASCMTIDPANDDNIYIGLGGISASGNGVDRVWKSADRGLTWTDMSTGLSSLPINYLFYLPGSTEVIFAATDAGVFKWHKFSSCWVLFNKKMGGGTIPPLLATKIAFNACKNKLVMIAYGRGIWETSVQSTPLTTDITTSTTWSADKIINGNLIIATGATLTIQGTGTAAGTSNVNVLMGADKKIVVNKGAKLIIDGARITNECGEMWNGIFVRGDNTKNQQVLASGYYEQGYVELKNNATIEYAKTGITNNNSNGFASGCGGIIKVNNSNILNCIIGVNMANYIQTVAGAPIDDASSFKLTTFNINNNFRDIANKFKHHFQLKGVRGILIENSNLLNDKFTLSNQPPNNTNTTKGIYSFDASYNFKNNTSSGYNICRGMCIGVHDANYNLGTSLSHTKIQKVSCGFNEIGLYMTNSLYPNIEKNIFTIGKKVGIYPAGTTWSYYSLGAKLENVSYFTYFGNSHNKTILPPFTTQFQYTAGTEIYNAGDIDHQIENNSYSGLTYGNDCCYTNGSNDPAVIRGINYKCNYNMSNKNADFILGGPGICRKIQSDGTTLNKSAGNWFSSNITTNFGWQATTGSTIVDYYYNPSIIENPSLFNSINYTGILATDNVVCISPPLSIAPPSTTSLIATYDVAKTNYDNYQTLFNGLLDNGNTNSALLSVDNYTKTALELKAELLTMSPFVSADVLREVGIGNRLPNSMYVEVMIANPEATQSEEFMHFLAAEKPNPLPNWMLELVKQSWTGINYRTVLSTNMGVAFEQMSNARNGVLINLRENANEYNVDNIYTWLQKAPTLRGNYEIIEFDLHRGNYAAAELRYTNMLTQFKFSALELAEHTLYGTLYAFKKAKKLQNRDFNEFDAADIAALVAIADNAKPVFPRSMAREALCFNFDICYSMEHPTVPIALQKKETTSKTEVLPSEVDIYPNPAKDYFTIEYHLANSNEVKGFKLYDVNGRPMLTKELKGTAGVYTVDTRSLAKGIYIYVIATLEGKTINGKITIK
jgi:Secretion system C-terminal sorting domain